MLDFMMRAKIPIQILPICFWLPSGYDYVHLTALHGLEKREGTVGEGGEGGFDNSSVAGGGGAR